MDDEPAAQADPAFAPDLPAACIGVDLLCFVARCAVAGFALRSLPKKRVDAW